MARVFDHVTIRVADREVSEAFYRSVLGTLGYGVVARDDEFTQWGDFSVAQVREERPITHDLHLGFVAPDRKAVNAFWDAGIAAGFSSDGDPGPRHEYGPDYYGAFLIDPDGNSAEAVVHENLRTDGMVDHVWMRVADLAASRAFYEVIAPHAGFRKVVDTDELVRFRTLAPGGGSLTIVGGEPRTGGVHLAFPATEDGTVDAFHAAATGAGHPDHGGPGERPQYHPGYYGAFVLDPDGNNIEVVHHGVTPRRRS